MSTLLRRNTSSYSTAPAQPESRPNPPQGYTEAAKNLVTRLKHGVQRSSSHSTTTEQGAAKAGSGRNFGPTSRQTTSYKTGLKLRALDINQARTHVVLAGGKILKTVRLDDIPSCTEDFNLRTAAVNAPWTPSPEQEFDHNAKLQQEIYDTAALNRETFDIEDVAWSNNEFKDSIATAARNGKIMLYNINRPDMEIARLHEHLQQVHKVDFNPLEGGVLLSGSQDGTVRLWDLRSLQKSAMICSSRETYPGRSQSVRHVKWSPISTWTFAFSTDNGGLQRWDTRNNRTPLLKIVAHDGHCNTVDWHPDGKHLASAGQDMMVKVWNMASEESRLKPLYIVRAPHSVQNVRWRPSCFVSEDSVTTAKQCTHFATSYRHYPVVHVWDLRRPHIPFREIHHSHNTGTTDMLWRTRDLLWTVGPEGEFTQSDVPFAPKTLDRRPTSTLAVSTSGDMNFYIMKRHNRHVPKLEQSILKGQAETTSNSQAYLANELPFGRSPGDDSVEENFIATFKSITRQRAPSFKSTRSLGTTPPSIEDTMKTDTVDLTIAMQDFDLSRTIQCTKTGPLPGAEPELITTYMAQKCKGPRTDLSLDLDYVLNIRSLFDQNAVYAQRASRYREAQTWRIMGAQAEKDIRANAVKNRRIRLSAKSHGVGDDNEIDLLENAQPPHRNPLSRSQSHSSNTPHSKAQHDSTKALSKRTIETTSNMTTPVARPADAYVNGATQMHTDVPAVNEDVQLPPATVNGHTTHSSAQGESTSFLSSSTTSSGEDGSGIARQVPSYDRQTSNDSFMFSMSADSDSSGAKSPRRYSNDDRSVKGDTGDEESSPPAQIHNDISASFGSQSQLFPASYDAPRTQLLPHQIHSVELSEKSNLTDTNLPVHNGPNGIIPHHGSSHSTPPEPSIQISYLPPVILPGQTQVQILHIQPAPETPRLQARDGTADEVPPLNLDDVRATDVNGGRSAGMLTQLLNFYIARGENRLASQLFILASSVLTPDQLNRESKSLAVGIGAFPVKEDPGGQEILEYLIGPPLNMTPSLASEVVKKHNRIFQTFQYEPWRIEAFLSVYHEQLLAKNLLNPAAVLRKHSYPAFPAVYEQALIDTYIGLLCTQCSNPINNISNRMLCETCGGRQAPCCICWLTNSPFDSSYGAKTPQRGTESPVASVNPIASDATPGANIWACCAFCNHSAHVACMSAWFADAESHGACPTQGCLCECLWGGARAASFDGGVERDVRKTGTEGTRKDGKEGKERTVRFLDG